MRRNEAEKLLKELSPRESAKVIDLVRDAGVDTSAWKFRKDGSLVKRPAANPKFCYEWTFGDAEGVQVFCVWHDNVVVSKGAAIVTEGNMRKLAADLELAARKSAHLASIWSRARSQAVRAESFDRALQLAYRANRPLRIVLLSGRQRNKQALGADAASVKFRRLDALPWTLAQYSEANGSYILKRQDVGEWASQPTADVDELARKVHILRGRKITEPPVGQKKPVPQRASAIVYPRDPAVKAFVLNEAAGVCEGCGKSAPFQDDDGRPFLEVHHVRLLSDGGSDRISNAVALCPNCHRRCHYSADRIAFKKQLYKNCPRLQEEPGEQP